MLNIPLMSNNIKKEDIDSLIEFLKTADRFTQGPKVQEFERAWAEWLGVKHVLFVNSGSSANFITMAVIRDLYGAGEIIVPPIAWSSDISSIFAAGHTPVFVDVGKKNLAMMESEILSHITEKTRAVFLTHVLGFNGLSEFLVKELEKRNIPLIEDVCESHGATMNGKKCGSFGLASNFSFYYAHHMSTIEGGVICTNDNRFYQYCRLYRSHGMVRESTDENLKAEIAAKYPELRPEFLFLVPGYNMRGTELNAVIGLNQIKRLDENNRHRVENFKLFLEHLDPEKYYTDFDVEGAVNYAFVILLSRADPQQFKKLTDTLRAENVEFRRGTAGGGNLARQPFVCEQMPEFDPATLTNAEFIHFYGLYTGNYPDLSHEKILQLCDLLNGI
ncbi:GDP-4-keto-6-deoxy-D-mannose 3-dehydratase [bioreactor metagenome]|uniref:GDP-4-keto-6-deoxy-D-mannose 3-dehydratase n=1 Tax=bioreactor metagenome TaxID=1076179 RepID=A0A644WYJ4_9ZZZZ|nr:DegT/DnrJ/EryC1/StrS aminotransferase family protein [Clostridiaceae bacterium]